MPATHSESTAQASSADPKRVSIDTYYGVSRGLGSSRLYHGSPFEPTSFLSNKSHQLDNARDLRKQFRCNHQRAQLVYTAKKQLSLKRLRRYAQAATLSLQEEKDWQDELSNLESIENQWETEKAAIEHRERMLPGYDGQTRGSRQADTGIPPSTSEEPTYHIPPQKRPWEDDYPQPHRLRQAPAYAADSQISRRAVEKTRQNSDRMREPQVRQLSSRYYRPTTTSRLPISEAALNANKDKTSFGNTINGTRANALHKTLVSVPASKANNDFTGMQQQAAEPYLEYLPALAYNPNNTTSAAARATAGDRLKRFDTQYQKSLETGSRDRVSRPDQVAGLKSAAALPPKPENHQHKPAHYSETEAFRGTQYNSDKQARKSPGIILLNPLHDGTYPGTPSYWVDSRGVIRQRPGVGRVQAPVLEATSHTNTPASGARWSKNPIVKNQSSTTPISGTRWSGNPTVVDQSSITAISGARWPPNPTVEDESPNTLVSSSRSSNNTTVRDQSPDTRISGTRWSNGPLVEDDILFPSQDHPFGSLGALEIKIGVDAGNSKPAVAEEDVQYNESTALSSPIPSLVSSPSTKQPSSFKTAVTHDELLGQKTAVTISSTAKVEKAECNPNVLDSPSESQEPTSLAASITSLNRAEPSVKLENTTASALKESGITNKADSSEEESEDEASDAATFDMKCAADSEVDKSQTSPKMGKESESRALDQIDPSTITSRSSVVMEQLGRIVEKAVHRANQLNQPYVGRAVQDIYCRSLRDHAVADLMCAVASKDVTETQLKDFHRMVLVTKEELKAADKERSQQATKDSTTAGPDHLPESVSKGEDSVVQVPNIPEHRKIDAAVSNAQNDDRNEERPLEDDLENLSLSSTNDSEQDTEVMPNIESQLDDSPWEEVDAAGMEEDEDYNLQVMRANHGKVSWTEAARRKAWSWVR